MIDATYQSVIARLPEELREAARGLLFALGLARTPDSGWADVFQLPPSRDLPLFAPPVGLSPDSRALAAHRRAHHAACFHHVLVDRLADRQAPSTPERERLAAHFLASWRRGLAEATGDAREAERDIDRGLRDWRRGVALEHEALARGRLSLERYGHAVLLKLGWAGLASESLLRSRVEDARRQCFRRAFSLLALGMQCVDDAEDSAEDALLHGRSLPQALGFSPSALFSAGGLLTRTAASLAEQGGFERFAAWLAPRAGELEEISARRIHPADNLAGLVIATSLEAACDSVDTSSSAS